MVDAIVWFIAVAGGALLTVNPPVGTPIVIVGGVAYYWLKRSVQAAMPRAEELLRIDAETILVYALQVGGHNLLSVSVWIPSVSGRLDLWAYASNGWAPAEGRRTIDGDSTTAIWQAFQSRRPYLQRQSNVSPTSSNGEPTTADGTWTLRLSFPLCHTIDRIRVVGVLSFECDGWNFEEKDAWQLATGLSKHLEPALSAVSEANA